jgi:glycerophosphoryl diester phosphodiesterase
VSVGSTTKEDPLRVAKELHAVSIHAEKRLATRDSLARAWEQGFAMYLWTVNDVREMVQFASLGIQGLISDFPERFSKVERL